jgi:signal transduction histidine kinase
VDATDARQKGGAGLGLSIVKETMARLGGSVGCDAAPNGGSVFHVDVPRWRPAARMGDGVRAARASAHAAS